MRKFRLLTSFFLFTGIFSLFFLPPTDPDLGWQLRCGQEIWTSGTICSPNHFSALLANFPYINHSFGYQVLLYPFFKLLSFTGLSFLNSIVLLVSFFLLLRLSGDRNIRLVLIPLVILFSWSVFSFGIRGQVLSFLYLLVILYLVDYTDGQNRKIFWLIPPVIFLWSNSHGSFILGIALILFLFIQKTADLIAKRINFKEYRSMSLIYLISLLASFINPFTYKVYLEAWRHFYTVHLNTLIAEWVPPNTLLRLTILLFFGLACFVLFKFSNQRLRLFKFLALIALTLLAFKARRNLPFFFVFTTYTLTSIEWKIKNLEPVVLLCSLTIFVSGVLFQLPRTIAANKNLQSLCEYSSAPKYACQAVIFLRQQSQKGNIFNTYEQGGFLIWQLPEHKVFIDGRMPAWPTSSGKSPYTIYLDILQTRPGWQETLKEYNIDWLFIGPGTFMDLKVRSNPQFFGWQEVYRDKIAVIYKKL